MTSAVVSYLRAQFISHARLFFKEPAAQLLQSDSIRFLPYSQAIATRQLQIVIPTDLPISSVPESPWTVAFNGTQLTLWNRIPNPDAKEWKAIPNESAPAWFQHTSGTLIPAWNLLGNAFQLLTFGEEKGVTQKDHHGRFAAEFSPRTKLNLLEVPAVNETIALLVAALSGMKTTGMPSFTLDNLLRPPVVVLSHDCDILFGNDFWTQSVRAFRTIQPLIRLRLPQIRNLWWILRNLFSPRRFYFDNATGMIGIERCFGFTSTYYLLNGTSGRFGARNPFSANEQLLKQIPSSWDVGIHYNYDTFLHEDRFSAQLAQLKQVVPQAIVSGRAHYLRFDPFRSFSFLQKFGIYVDESSGYADRIGYRNGIAGCFQVFDLETQSPRDIWEVPLVIMEARLVEQYKERAVQTVEQHLHHLSRVGGSLTILVHPGQFFNPEHPEMLGIYHDILKLCRKYECTSETAKSLVEKAK